MAKTWRNNPQYVRQREALKRHYQAGDLPCAECGKPFLWEYEDRKAYPEYWKDPRSFTADHIAPIATGGHMAPGIAGLRGLHRACNSRRGDGTRNKAPKSPIPTPLKTSRKW